MDKERDWSSENLGQCILISLDTEFTKAKLEEKHFPKEIYEMGLLPKFIPDRNIIAFRINPKELCTGAITTNTNQFNGFL